jgi:phosphoribosylformimino-5-aminoimidazole carboxamide ribotide isomerase
MRLIPVIDLLNNQAVHAVRGKRKHYKPVKSVLCNSSDPLEIAVSFRDKLGLNEIYIADLDALQDSDRTKHRNLIEHLSSREGFRILLDAGISGAGEAQNLLNTGIYRVIIGAETLNSMNALKDIPSSVDPGRLIFSLDCRNGEIISACPELAGLSPINALEHLESSGWREVILLDLARAGSGLGIDCSLIIEAQAGFPELTLLAGGGITGPEELSRLQSLGVGGVLVATAFHNGTIGPQHHLH